MDVNAGIYLHKLRVVACLLSRKHPDFQLRPYLPAAPVLNGDLVHHGIRHRNMASKLVKICKDPAFLQKLLHHGSGQFFLFSGQRLLLTVPQGQRKQINGRNPFFIRSFLNCVFQIGKYQILCRTVFQEIITGLHSEISPGHQITDLLSASVAVIHRIQIFCLTAEHHLRQKTLRKIIKLHMLCLTLYKKSVHLLRSSVKMLA